MAILKRISLHNFAQHRQLDLDLGPGLTAMVGPNGSGKTNCLLSVLLTLTADYKLFPQNKAALVRRGESKKSWVQTTWELRDGTVIDARRVLKGGTSDIIINGVEQGIRREADMTKRLEELLGFEKSRLLSNHFVAQSKVNAIIQEEPTDRVIQVASLFGAERLLIPAKEPIAQELAWLQGRLSNAGADASLLLQERFAYVKEYASLLPSKFAAEKKLLSPEDKERHQSLLRKREEREELQRSRQTKSGLLNRNREQLKQTQLAIAQIDAELVEKEASLSQLQQVAQQQARRRELSNQLETLKADWLRAKQDYANSQSTLASKPPERPAGVTLTDEQIAKLTQSQHETLRKIKLIDEGKQSCDHCGSEIPLADWSKDELLRSFQEGSNLLSGDKRLRERLAAYDKDRQQHEVDVATARRAADSLSPQLLRFEMRHAEVAQAIEAIALDAAAPQKCQALAKEIDCLRKERLELTRQLGQYESAAASLTEDLQQIRTKLAGITSKNDTIYSEASEALAAHSAAETSLSVIRRSMRQTLAAWRVAKNQYLAAKMLEDENKPLANWYDLVVEVAAAVKPTEMPRAVLSSMLGELMEPVSLICHRLGLPFTISHNDKLELLANHLDGSQEPAKCLSGGQQTSVALAFWIAKLLRLRTGLPLLFVDEPAAALDAQAVVNFSELLFELSKLLAEHGCQVIFTTHHQQLKLCAQHCISFYEEAKA